METKPPAKNTLSSEESILLKLLLVDVPACLPRWTRLFSIFHCRASPGSELEPAMAEHIFLCLRCFFKKCFPGYVFDSSPFIAELVTLGFEHLLGALRGVWRRNGGNGCVEKGV